jgi:hypothetical protein
MVNGTIIREKKFQKELFYFFQLFCFCFDFVSTDEKFAVMQQMQRSEKHRNCYQYNKNMKKIK